MPSPADRLQRYLRRARLAFPSRTYPGYVTQYDPVTKKARRVPWHQSMTIPGQPGWAGLRNYEVEFDPREVFTDLPEQTRRTPQERVASMTKRLVDEYNRTGVVPKDLIDRIAGEYNRRGLEANPETFRIVAAALLQEADRKAKGNRDRAPEIYL